MAGGARSLARHFSFDPRYFQAFLRFVSGTSLKDLRTISRVPVFDEDAVNTNIGVSPLQET